MIPVQAPYAPTPAEYENSLAAEKRIYSQCLDVHSLPEIFHHWSNRHVLPALQAFGMAGPAEMFEQNLILQFSSDSTETRRFVSLGSGNCDLEIHLAKRLRERGQTDFALDCVDLNPEMLERGGVAARKAGVEDCLSFTQGDFNSWKPGGEYHAVIANQSLHHVVNLEHLFTEVKHSLTPGGVFVISDIIGRNGHMRWPEALPLVHSFWRRLPPSYRWNRKAGAYEELFADHDCSGEGFEGVRSQDILPLLLSEFHFRFFFPFGNLIDPFVDRSFGPNFDATRECDRLFIDAVHLRDEFALAAGKLTPTHMMAAVTKNAGEVCVFRDNLSPRFCLRREEKHGKVSRPDSGPVYQWENARWTDTPREELDKVCGMLVESAKLAARQTAWALSLEREAAQRLKWGEDLEKQLDGRTEWALKLDSDLKGRTAWALNLNKELANKTEWVSLLEAWAKGLQADVEERTGWAQRLETELEERTAWALRLQAELAVQSERAEGLDRQIHGYLRNPLRLIVRIFSGVRRRMGRTFSRKIEG